MGLNQPSGSIKKMKQIDYQQPGSMAMNQQDAIDRLLSGKSSWNQWANALLAEKLELIAQGKWQVERVWDQKLNAIVTKSEIDETQNWLNRARVDFSNLIFTSKVKEYLDNQANPKQPAPIRPNNVIVVEGEHIDFKDFIFPSIALFNNCNFKAGTNFNQTHFLSDAWFQNAIFESQATFNQTQFEGDAWFNKTVFKKGVQIKGVTFHLGAWFNNARFGKKVQITNCLFKTDAWFKEALFKGRVLFQDIFFKADLAMSEAVFKARSFFNNIQFQGTTNFKETTFSGRALFQGCWFHKEAVFNQCDFAGYAIFTQVRFKQATSFKASHIAKGFTIEQVEFTNQVPNFRQALFREPARIKDIDIIPAPKRARFSKRIRQVATSLRHEKKWLRKLFYIDTVHTDWAKKYLIYQKNRFLNARRQSTDETYYKSLERIAQEADNVRAQKQFIAGQVRSRRHMKDKASELPGGTFNYIQGVTSEFVSDFGRSLVRPAMAWGLVFAAFTGVYLSQATNSIKDPCGNKTNVSPIAAAQSISWRNAFAINLQGRQTMDTMHTCLYGHAVVAKKENKDQTRLAGLTNVPTPPLPPKPMVPSGVVFWGSIHTALSFFLIGLFAINLRNRFKMT